MTPPRAGRREWIGLAVIALPCLLYSMDLTVLNLAIPALSADLQPSSAQLLWIVDIYGFLVAGPADHDGHAGRPHRPPPAADDRRGGLRPRLGAGRIRDQRRDADRHARAARRRRRDACAVDPVADPQHVPRPGQRTFAIGVWVTSYSVGRRDRPADRRRCCWSTSGGAPCSCIGVPVMLLLLALGPRAAARVPRPQRRAAWTWSAWRSRWSACSP